MSSFEWPALDSAEVVKEEKKDVLADIASDIHYVMTQTEQGERILDWLRKTYDEPAVHMVGSTADYAPYREGQRSVYKTLLHLIKKAEGK